MITFNQVDTKINARQAYIDQLIDSFKNNFKPGYTEVLVDNVKWTVNITKDESGADEVFVSTWKTFDDGSGCWHTLMFCKGFNVARKCWNYKTDIESLKDIKWRMEAEQKQIDEAEKVLDAYIHESEVEEFFA